MAKDIVIRGYMGKIAFIKKNQIGTEEPERDIFFVFSIIALIAAFLASLINLYLGLWEVLGVSFSVFIIQGFMTYYGRKRKNFKLAAFLSAAPTATLICVNFFYNAGIVGPSLIYLTAIFYFSIAVSPLRQAKYWLLANIIIIWLLVLTEFKFPNSIILKYQEKGDYFFDILLSYSVVLLIIYYGTVYIRKTYISQRKEIEANASELERIIVEKDKIFSIISHDLRSPLANIQNYLQVMNSIALSPSEKVEIERDLLDSTKNTQELLNNLLAWSQSQMGRAVPLFSYFNLLDKITATIEHISFWASKKEIVLKTYIPPDLFIYADENMLNLVIRNLLSNAIKFTQPDGCVKITAAMSEENPKECVISIADNGKGISLKDQQNVFSLTMKSNRGTANEKGTGLGLILCKEYVEKQAGKIWFHSEENKGTTFYLSFAGKQ